MNESKKCVFLLYHTHQLDEDDEDDKLIGVYSSSSEATSAKERAKTLPGFDQDDGEFSIVEYEINKDHWIEGFVTSVS